MEQGEAHGECNGARHRVQLSRVQVVARQGVRVRFRFNAVPAASSPPLTSKMISKKDDKDSQEDCLQKGCQQKECYHLTEQEVEMLILGKGRNQQLRSMNCYETESASIANRHVQALTQPLTLP